MKCRMNLIDGSRLDLESLRERCKKPRLFAPGRQPFWDDPHISRQMLRAHLDPDVDAASRRPEFIDESTEAIISHLHLRPGDRVLDLGCGPGLYAQRLNRRGLRVTGIDCSRSSVRYARERARSEGLPIEYVHGDYLTEDFPGGFAAVLLIYGDLGALTDAERDVLLPRVRCALRPGGHFVFDVTTWYHGDRGERRGSWRLVREGFWRPHPHLVLESRFAYPEHDTTLNQYAVIEESGETSVYRIWDHYYSPETVSSLLSGHGFAVRSLWGDLTGAPLEPESPWLGVVAARPGG